MEASAEMKWGLICSIDDQQQIPEFIKFGSWMVKQLEDSAAKLHLGHRFFDSPTFVLHAKPGCTEDAKAAYAEISARHPQVSYVIHVLPAKDSLEYQVLKEMTLEGALIGQGVLAENALNHFKCYVLDEVMANMNQWIARRLAQITARRTKDQYRLTVTGTTGGFGNGSRFKTGANATPLVDRSVLGTKRMNMWSYNASGTPMNDFDVPINIVLHSSQADSGYHSRSETPQLAYHPQRSASGQRDQRQAHQQKAYQNQHNFEGKEREKEVIVGGYPLDFNKFQIASLFPDFRPLNVQYIAAGEALVQFKNKFHAAQVIGAYNGRSFENEHFTLQVRSAAQEEPSKQIEAVKKKLAGLLLKETTQRAAGQEVLEEAVKRRQQKQQKKLTKPMMGEKPSVMETKVEMKMEAETTA